MWSSKALRRLHAVYVTVFLTVIVVVLNQESWWLISRLVLGVILMVFFYYSATALSERAERAQTREKFFSRSKG